MEAKKKIIYIFPCEEKNKSASGFERKVQMQRRAFESYGITCEIERLHDKTSGYWMKLLRRFTFAHLYSDADIHRIVDHVDLSVDAVYIRRPFLDLSILHMLKEIKVKAPDIKLLWEFPTYPYDSELRRIVDVPVLLREKVLRKKLKYYLDRFITFSNDNIIFDVPCINIDNGIDCDEVKVRNHRSHSVENEIHLLGVAQLAYWHGYDRVIRGLHEYYKNKPDRKVHFHIVGDGSIAKNWKKLSCDLNVEPYVHFHGWMHGKELDDMFDGCDIGVGCLGGHRQNLIYGNSLKLREYAARGLPFFYSDVDLTMEKYFKEYLMNIPANDDFIAISDVIHFYDKMNTSGSEKVALEMRGQAEKYLSWVKQLQPVINYIFAGSSEKDSKDEGKII